MVDCRTEQNEKKCIHFTGIRAFIGNEFREGNIILAVTIYQGHKIPEEEIKQVLFNQYSRPDDITKMIEELHASDEYFLHLEPSYGLELKAFCTEIIIN